MAAIFIDTDQDAAEIPTVFAGLESALTSAGAPFLVYRCRTARGSPQTSIALSMLALSEGPPLTHIQASWTALFGVQIVGADCTAAIAHAIHNRQTRRLMLVEFAPDIFKGLIFAAASACRTHDFFDANFRCAAVISGDFVAHVALGDHADDFAALFIFNNRRATASSLAHGY